MGEHSEANDRGVSPVASASAGARPGPGATRTCHNYWCNYTTEDQHLSRCPRCKQPLLTARTYSLLGLALALVGGSLALTGALLIIFAAPGVIAGTAAKVFVWGIFGLLVSVGLSAMTAGVWQMLFGRRNQLLMTVVVALVITILLIAVIGPTVL